MASKMCALIRQTWYETAKKNLQPSERLRFYEMCFEFEFFEQEPDPDAPFSSRLLFDMIRNDIENDKERATARAERSRQNGSHGGRPRVTEQNSETQNPEKPTGMQKTLLQNNTLQNTTLQNNESQEDEDSHMFFNVCLLFFEKGCSDPVGEANTFWNYYAAMGWRTKGGGEVMDRFALAKAWRLNDCSKTSMRSRAAYADLMHKANPVETSLLTDFVSMNRDAATETVNIVLQERSTCILLDKKYMPALMQWIPKRADGSLYSLTYSALHATID